MFLPFGPSQKRRERGLAPIVCRTKASGPPGASGPGRNIFLCISEPEASSPSRSIFQFLICWQFLLMKIGPQSAQKNIPKIYPNISKISKLNTKYQAAAGPARPGPSPGPRPGRAGPAAAGYFVFILGILDIPWIYLYNLNIFGYIWNYLNIHWYIFWYICWYMF